MEEIQIRDALRHHVTDNEPPMGLCAADLVSKGRRRHRWRMGVASGGTVVAISMVGTIALVPMGGTVPLLDSACSLPVITAYEPQPTAPPEHPSQYPTPYPTTTAYPTKDPSPYPTSVPTPYPTSVPTPYPTSVPTPYPTFEPTSYPTFEPTPYPTSYPTAGPSFFPTQHPSGYPTMVPYPTVVPSHLTPEPSGTVGYPAPSWATQVPEFPPDEARMREMECYLKRELQRMVPEAKFARSGDHGPLTVHTSSEWSWNGRGWDPVYETTAIIIGRGQTTDFVIRVQKPPEVPMAPEPGLPWTVEKRGDSIIRQFSSIHGMMVSEVQTPHSIITTHSTGTLLSPEQMTELASATEVDMFR